MTNCCKPLYHAVKTDISNQSVAIYPDKIWTDLSDEFYFNIIIPQGMIPPQNIAQVYIATALQPIAILNYRGDFLRADSLYKYIKTRVKCNPFAEVVLSCFKGNDPTHVTVFNRMCPSSSPIATA